MADWKKESNVGCLDMENIACRPVTACLQTIHLPPAGTGSDKMAKEQTEVEAAAVRILDAPLCNPISAQTIIG